MAGASGCRATSSRQHRPLRSVGTFPARRCRRLPLTAPTPSRPDAPSCRRLPFAGRWRRRWHGCRLGVPRRHSWAWARARWRGTRSGPGAVGRAPRKQFLCCCRLHLCAAAVWCCANLRHNLRFCNGCNANCKIVLSSGLGAANFAVVLQSSALQCLYNVWAFVMAIVLQ
jgi:hypothetical protein